MPILISCGLLCAKAVPVKVATTRPAATAALRNCIESPPWFYISRSASAAVRSFLQHATIILTCCQPLKRQPKFTLKEYKSSGMPFRNLDLRRVHLKHLRRAELPQFWEFDKGRHQQQSSRDRGRWGEVRNEMSINLMQSAHDAPRCKAKSKRTGKPVVRPRFAAVVSAGCMEPVAVRRRVSRMAITGTARAQKRRSRQ